MTSDPRPDPLPEPERVYEPGERRTGPQHAAEAYDEARRASAMDAGGWPRPDVENALARAQWHATMAIYETLATRS